MQPAAAMGTFLRVWRSEWAGLSRAQLANAIQRHLNGRAKVTPGVVRWWETGQPPASTEELEALCLVMRSHELTAPEVEQFRNVVFAACANRQYPGLFEDDGFAHSPQVAEAAAAMFLNAGHEMASTNTVAVTACYHELRTARREDTGPQMKAKRHRQEMALVCLRALLSQLHFFHGRRLLAAVEANSTAANLRPSAASGDELVSALSGRGLWLDAERLDIWAACDMFTVDGSPAHVQRLVTIAQTASEPGVAYAALGEAMTYAAGVERLDLLEPVRDMVRDHLAAIPDCNSVLWAACGHRTHFWVSLACGRIAEAEAHAENMGHLNQPSPVLRSQWSWCMGRLAFARGRYEEAREQFLEALRLAGMAGLGSYESQLRLDVKTCEQRAGGERGGTVPPLCVPHPYVRRRTTSQAGRLGTRGATRR